MSKVKELILSGMSFYGALKEANVEVISNNHFVTRNEQDAIYIYDFLSSPQVLMNNTKVELIHDIHGRSIFEIKREKI